LLYCAAQVTQNIVAIEKVADDIGAETSMRVIGRKINNIDERLRNLRRGFRRRIEEGDLLFTDEDGIAVIQRAFRGYRIRRVLSLLYVERTVRVWDAAAGRDFFFDRENETSSWTPPTMLMRMDINKLPEMELDAHGNTTPRYCWPCKKIKKRRRKIQVNDIRDAARVVAGLFRCVRARRRVMDAAKQRYARVWDPDYNQYFYSNLVTGDSSWSKPAVLLSGEVPLMLTDDVSKRSPRVNRQQLVCASEAAGAGAGTCSFE
jgi:hypothetical protein